MNLNEYFNQTKISRKEFIHRTHGEISEAMLSYILKGRRKPSAKMAEKIEQATNGMVSRLELLYP